MRRYLLASVLFLTVACTKESGNTSVISKQEQTTKPERSAYRALDGRRASVTTDHAGNGKGTISIEANGQKFQLDQVKQDGDRTEYERNGVKAVQKGDSLTIFQDGVEIPLVKIP